MLRSYLQFTGQDMNPATQSTFIIKDRYNGNIPVIHTGKYLLGILEALAIAYISSAYKDVFAFGVLIIILAIRPTGLFGGREA